MSRRRRSNNVGRRPRSRRHRRAFRRMPNPVSRISRPFPSSVITRLKYDQGIAIPAQTTAGIASMVYFGANDLVQPANAGGGHQPMGFDQYAALYNHYTVLGAKITVKFHSNNESQAGANIAGIGLRDDNIELSTSLEDICERPRTLWKFQSQNDAARGLVTVTMNYSAKKFFSIKDPSSKASIGANIAAQPADKALFMLFAGNPNPAVLSAAQDAWVHIEYIAKFWEPKDMLAS